MRPEPSWLIDGILPANMLAMLYGAKDTYKSFLALDMALCIAHGLDWHGHGVRQGDVLYVTAEGGECFRTRRNAWMDLHDAGLQDAGFFRMDGAIKLPDAHDVDSVLAQAWEHSDHYALVVIDTLSWCEGGKKENTDEMQDVVEGLDAIRRGLKATVLFLHHTTKNGNTSRGSSLLEDNVNTVLSVTAPREYRAILECKHQKDAAAFPAMTFNLPERPFKPREGHGRTGQSWHVRGGTSLVVTLDEQATAKAAERAAKKAGKAVEVAGTPESQQPPAKRGDKAKRLRHPKLEALAALAQMGRAGPTAVGHKLGVPDDTAYRALNENCRDGLAWRPARGLYEVTPEGHAALRVRDAGYVADESAA